MSAPTTTTTWTYDGGIDEIDVKLPSGRWIHIHRGDEVELLANEATAVSVLPGWSKAKPASKPAKADDSSEGDD